nr:MAG TPA: hypothetical protein [Caudoviricetes sp.]
MDLMQNLRYIEKRKRPASPEMMWGVGLLRP